MDVEKIQKLKHELITSVFRNLCKYFRDFENENEDESDEKIDDISLSFADLVSLCDKFIAKELSGIEFTKEVNAVNNHAAFIETDERELLCELLRLAGEDMTKVDNIRTW